MKRLLVVLITLISLGFASTAEASFRSKAKQKQGARQIVKRIFHPFRR